MQIVSRAYQNILYKFFYLLLTKFKYQLCIAQLDQIIQIKVLLNKLDFCCGLVAGWSQVLIGQPFDFVKTKIQSNSTGNYSIYEIAKQIKDQHGLTGFYRGSSSLLFGFAFTIGTEFLIFEYSKRKLFSILHCDGPFETSKLRLWEICIAGVTVGLTTSFIYCPVQYVKIQKQMMSSISEGSLALLFREIYSNGFRNIFKGYSATLSRESIGSGFYFGTYESIVRGLTKRREEATSWQFLLAGGMAGISYHIVAYPFDTIKTNMQLGRSFKQSWRACLSYKKLNGYKVVLPRAVLANSCCFAIYETCQKQLKALINPQ